MSLNDRQQAILDQLKDSGRIGVRPLAERFAVSEMTIRRDLALLERHSLLTRTHGGGVSSQRVSFDLFLGDKMKQNASAKEAIARAAARLVEPGDTIVMDTGTTVFLVAEHLAAIPDLTVATPSLAVASSLFWKKSARLIVLGGYIKPWSPDLIGSLTESNVRTLHFRKAFLGADGVDPASGFFCNDLASANVVREIIKASDTVYVLADSSKIGVKSLIPYAGFADIDMLITDNRDPDKVRAMQKKLKTVVA